MAREQLDWKEEHELTREKEVNIHGHLYGFRGYVGHMASDENPVRTIRVQMTEPNRNGVVKVVRDKDFESGKAVNWQMILPDDVDFLEKYGQFVLDFAGHIKSQIAAEAQEALDRAKAAGVQVEGAEKSAKVSKKEKPEVSA